MEVEVKLYGQLRRYRPEGISGAPHQPFRWPAVGGTAVALAHELGIPDGLVNAVAVNGTAVDLTAPLRPGDQVSLFPPSAGGAQEKSMVKDWEKLNSEILGDYRIFRSRKDTRRSPRTGNIHQFYVLEAADWVNIIPLTPDDKVVMVHQFRHGREAITLEIPGGIVDPEDDSPGDAAQRELLEETGYIADHIIHIGSVDPNPAFLDNQLHTFLALGARQIQKPEFDGAEDIAIEEVPLSDIPTLIRHGRISHALVVAAFYHYENFVSGNQ